MRPSVVKAKLRKNESVRATTLHFADPSSYEIAGRMGFDAIWMDMEHQGYSVETATGLIRAARVGTADIMTRPAKGEFMRKGRMRKTEAGLPPTIVFPGTGDKVCKFKRVEQFQEAMSEVGTISKLVVHPAGRHGYFLYDLKLYEDAMAKTEGCLVAQKVIDRTP